MAELDGELLRQKEQATQQDNKVAHTLSNSGLRGLARIIYDPQSNIKTQDGLQGSLFNIDLPTQQVFIKGDEKYSFTVTTANNTAITPVEHALFERINIEFAHNINIGQTTMNDLRAKELRVNLNLLDYMRLCGKDEDYINNADNVKKFKKRTIAPALNHLESVKMSWRSDWGNYKNIQPIYNTGINGNIIEANISLELAETLIKKGESVFTLFDERLIKIAHSNRGKSRAGQIAFILGKKFCEHASINRNVKNSEKGQFSLAMESIIETVKHCLPQNTKRAERDIINPICEALDILVDEKIIDYCFCDKGKKRLGEIETAQVRSKYSTFIKSFVCFSMVNFNTIERQKELLLTHKAERKPRKRGRPRIDHNKVYEAPKQ